MWKKRLFRFVKWFVGIIVGLVLLISGGLYFFKDEICGLVIDEVNGYLNTEVQVSKVDLAFWGSFPNLSVDFDDVFIKDNFPGATNRDTLLYTERIRLKFNPMDIWRENYTVKSIEVSPGTLQLKVNEEGVNNYDILKEKEDSVEQSGVDVNLESILFENFRISYSNTSTDQVYRTHMNQTELKGALSEEVFTTSATSAMTILEAKSGNVTLIRNQPAQLEIAVNVNQDSNTIDIPKSTIYISELPFTFNGHVDTNAFDFHIAAKNISISEAANRFSLKETEDVKRFKGRGNLLFDLSILGNNSATDPAEVECLFGIKKGYLFDQSSQIALRDLMLDGHYSNKGGKQKEFLRLKDISFKTTGGPFRGNLMLTQFETPRFEGNADGHLDLGILHSLLRIPSIQTMKGTADIRSDFIVSSIHEKNEEINYHVEKCDGEVDVHNVNFQLREDKRLFRDINGKAFLRNNEAGIQNATLSIGKSDFSVNGVFKDIIDYFRGTGQLQADIDIKSKYILVSDLGASSKAEKVEQQRAYILPDDIQGDVYLDVERLDHEKHTFKSLHGNMNVSKRIIHFPRISVQNGGADVNGSLTIEERSPEYFYLSSQLVSKNIRFKPLFREWNDFDQKVIKRHNIQGVAQANVSFEAPFDMRGGIISSQIKSTIGLQIDNGKLKDVGAFKQITQSLRESGARKIIGAKNIDALERKLSNLSFDQLTNTIIIKNSKIIIPKMLISNSALDIEVSGTHTFDNQIDYHFIFRFRDLKEKKQSEFGEIVDDGTGFHVFMRMYGDMNNPTIKWDKEARKAEIKARREEEKKRVKSILKSEFGLFKKDTTVKVYQEEKQPHEELILEFNPVDSIDHIHEEKKPKKRNGKLWKKLDEWKKEQEDAKKEEFIFD